MSSASALDLWEYELLAAELDQALEPARAYYHHLRPYELPVGGMPLDHQKSRALFESLLQQAAGCVSTLGRVVRQEMTAALGPEGVPGDAYAIRRSAAKVGRIMVTLTSWENAAAAAWPALHWEKAFALLRGGTVPVWTAMEQLLEEIKRIPARARRGVTHVSISVDIQPSSRWAELPKAEQEAIRAGGSFLERHPAISGILVGELISKIFR